MYRKKHLEITWGRPTLVNEKDRIHERDVASPEAEKAVSHGVFRTRDGLTRIQYC